MGNLDNKNLCWLDLFDIQKHLIMVQHLLRVYNRKEISEEYRKQMLENLSNIVDVTIRDIDYLADTKLINGDRAYNLNDSSL